MKQTIEISNRSIGENNPVFVIAEIGLNHNGQIDLAKKLIDVAVEAGCDAVKFQKRDPELCVPIDQREVMRETPWGYISYFDYRYKIEFQEEEYNSINNYCREKNILWTASCWDVNSIDFINKYNPPFHKIPSACITNDNLVKKYAESGFPVILSTGMSTIEEIDRAVDIMNESESNYALLHCTSTYPCPINQINLKVIKNMKEKFNVPIGYSGHETGLTPTLASVALGSKIIERHITLDRSMWGSDQSASVEPVGLKRLVSGIRDVEESLGDGIKTVYPEEKKIQEKLRFI
tara:strand:+ start:699 stop:1574 length:876 start_codon:yes stop_codon:yes gene_type:complete